MAVLASPEPLPARQHLPAPLGPLPPKNALRETVSSRQASRGLAFTTAAFFTAQKYSQQIPRVLSALPFIWAGLLFHLSKAQHAKHDVSSGLRFCFHCWQILVAKHAARKCRCVCKSPPEHHSWTSHLAQPHGESAKDLLQILSSNTM